MLTCKEASRLISQRQDRELSMRERLALQMHLALCAGCSLVSSQLEFMRKALSKYAQRGAEPDDKR
jgi:hypothetical protein